MDKNTISGLTLMALVFLLFMWLSPKPEQTETADSRETETKTSTQTTYVDSLSASEKEWLIKNIASNGENTSLPDGRHATRINENGIDLTLSGDSIFGSVSVGSEKVDWKDIADRKSGAISPKTRHEAIQAVLAISNNMGKYGRFSKFLTGANSTTVLENDVMKLSFESKGGVPASVVLKKYDTEYSSDETKKVKNKVEIFNAESNHLAFTLPLPQQTSTEDLYFTPRMVNDSTLLMALDVAPGAYWGIEYTLPKGDSYVVGMRIVQKNMAAIVQSNVRTLGVNWQQEIKRQEMGRMFEERNSGLYYKFAGGSVENLSENKDDAEERQAKIKWIGFKNQFFSSVLISDKNFNMADFDSKILKNSDYLKNLTAKAEVNDYDWNAENPASFHLFLGPNLYPLLDDLDDTIDAGEDLKMTRLIPLGWALFRWINTWVIIPIFNFLGSFISNYGIIILLLTIFIKLVLFPLTYKSYKSQAKMRILAPDIQAINEKYPGNENAMLRQQKTMALYSKAGASPMSGCLPMLLQMPILFAMFTFFPSCIELRGQSFLWAHDLSAPDAIISWSGNIPLVTQYFGNHISLFCLLMTVTNIIYTRINMQNSAGNTMPGMKWMMYLMPVFFMVFFNNYASGLSYYYFLSLLITIAQTYAFRLVIKEEDVRKAMAENAKKPKKKSGWMARMEELQRQQQQMLKEQQKQQKKR